MKTKNIITRITSAVLALVAVFALGIGAAAVGETESGTCGENLTWTLDDSGTLTISGTGAMDRAAFLYEQGITAVVIEEGVTEISNAAFHRCMSLESVTIPSTVTRIGSDAFYDCTALTSITVPPSVTSIGDSAFAGCRSLTQVLGCEGVTSLGDGVFLRTPLYEGYTDEFVVFAGSLIKYNGDGGDVVIPDGVTRIDDELFSNRQDITSVTLPDSAVEIGERAFYTCAALERIDLGGVESIGDYAFHDCTALVEITSDRVASVGRSVLGDTPWLTGNEDEFVMLGGALLAYNGDGGDVVIPEGVVFIGEQLFAVRDDVTSVTIPDSVAGIADNMFSGCTSVVSVRLPAGIDRIGYAMFAGCTSLSEITIPEGVTSIADRAFYDCTALRSVSLPETLESIGIAAFEGCASLEEIVIPDGVAEICNSAFQDCAALASVTLPSGIESLDSTLFMNCGSLESIAIPESVTSIEYSAFEGSSALVSVDIPQSVERIGDGAFVDCTALTAVTGAENVSEVGSDVLSNTPWLDGQTDEFVLLGRTAIAYNGDGGEVTVPDTVVGIGGGLFADRADITSVTLPAGLRTVGAGAFEGCTALADVYYGGTRAQWDDDVYIYWLNEALYSAALHCAPMSFADVADGDWYHDAVISAADAGLIAGNGDGSFGAGDDLTWAQTVAFAVRLAQYEAGERVYGASDQYGEWYDVYVSYARRRGIISETPDNPNMTITRGDAAVIFAAVLGDTETEGAVAEGYFADVAADDPAHDAIYKLAAAGICNGKGGGEFGVDDTFLRCEAAAIAARIAGLVSPVTNE